MSDVFLEPAKFQLFALRFVAAALMLLTPNKQVKEFGSQAIDARPRDGVVLGVVAVRAVLIS